jgi:hypothetical protein
MTIYSYADASQHFDLVLEDAKTKHSVMIQRPNGDLFLLRPVKHHEFERSLPRLGINLSREEIVETIREVRERSTV